MVRAQLAEALLSLFTARDRAASIVGDFEEEQAPKGLLRYWRAVTVTAFALCFKAVSVAPIRSLVLGIIGFAMNGCTPMVALLIGYWSIYPFVAHFVWEMEWQWYVVGALVAPSLYLLPILAG